MHALFVCVFDLYFVLENGYLCYYCVILIYLKVKSFLREPVQDHLKIILDEVTFIRLI